LAPRLIVVFALPRIQDFPENVSFVTTEKAGDRKTPQRSSLLAPGMRVIYLAEFLTDRRNLSPSERFYSMKAEAEYKA
jgi:hypothetical protein